jgi:hypothetical protein
MAAGAQPFSIQGSNAVKKARYLTITCLLICAVSGCGRGRKIELGDTNSEGFKDGQYYRSVRGMAAPAQFKAFLEGCSPTDRVKYINKSVEEEPSTRIFVFKATYQEFANDANSEVAAAAKDALSKVPTEEENNKLLNEQTSTK